MITMDNKALLAIIEHLRPCQKRRYIMYYVDGLTQEQIAKIEQVSQQMVQKSIQSAEKKIKKRLKRL